MAERSRSFLQAVSSGARIAIRQCKTHCGRKAVLSADREKLILERNDTKERVEACMAKQDFMGAKIYSEKLKKLNRILYNSEDFE